MPTFSQIDPILTAWSSEQGIPLLTSYKEVEVRSFDVVGSSGTRCQIWVEPARWHRSVTVTVWDYANRRRDLKATVSSLEARLDQALTTARSWL